MQDLSSIGDNIRANKIPYPKESKTPQELVQKLIDKKLIITKNNLSAVTSLLEKNGYFRIKAYTYPYIDEKSTFFHKDTYFSSVYRLYINDHKIRCFLFSIIAKIEIAIRSLFNHHMIKLTGDSFWHVDSQHFTDFNDVETALRKVITRIKQSKEEFNEHYRNKYCNPKSQSFEDAPPFWILAETLTIEQLYTFMKELNQKDIHKLNKFSRKLGFNSYQSLIHNIGCIKDLRNVCAHHSRLWNRNLKATNGTRKQLKFSPAHPNRLYDYVVLIQIMCNALKIKSGLRDFFIYIFQSDPTLRRDMGSMGFPISWDTDPIWGLGSNGTKKRLSKELLKPE